MNVVTKLGLKLCGFTIEHEYRNGSILQYVDMHTDGKLDLFLKFNLIDPMKDLQIIETSNGKDYYRAYVGLKNHQRQLLEL